MIDSSQSDEGDRPVLKVGSALEADPAIRPQVWRAGVEARTRSRSSAWRASRSGPPPPRIVTEVDPLHVIADLTPPTDGSRLEGSLRSVESEPVDGSLWGRSTQGWVRTTDGSAEWRTILTTADVIARYPTDTQLGLVTGEAAVGIHGDDTQHLGATLARAREMAGDGMAREAVARGAHAVIAISITYVPFAGLLLVTATGTAVTLSTPSRHSRDE